MAKKNENAISLKEVVGSGYKEFWSDRHRYRVVKGGRASKKSTTMALWLISHIMQYPLANALVVRKTYNTHHDSTFALLKWAASRFKVAHLWQFKENPLEAVYKPTKQKILFRGFDDVMKLTSITVEKGVLCWVWLEEAFEIDDEADFRTLDEAIRGEMPEGLWKQITLTYNPWVSSHWTKTRFWDKEDPDAFTLTTTYECNEWLDEADRKLITDLEKNDPERYSVVGLGEYGIPGGAYFSEFRRDIHVIEPFPIPKDWRRYVTIDYGLDMLAAYWIAVDWQNKAYVYKELYEGADNGKGENGRGHNVSDAVRRIREINDGEEIYQYIAPPDLWNRHSDTGYSTADLFGQNGIRLWKASNNRVQGWLNLKEWLAPYVDEHGKKTARLVFFKNCDNIIRCLPQLRCDEKDPNDIDAGRTRAEHELTHGPDAIRYWVSGRPKPGTQQVEEQTGDRFLSRFSGERNETWLGGEVTSEYLEWIGE